MFYGADSMIRIGEDPKEIVEKMEKRGFASFNFIKGSFAYYRHRDRKKAAEFLMKAFKSKAFTNRTTRLLAKVLTEMNEARRALEVFDELGDRWVHNDSGLLSQKIKCLRAVGRAPEADRLMSTLQNMDDEYGDSK